MPKYLIRYGSMRFLGVFTTRGSDAYLRGSKVIARTTRGLELAEVLCEASDETQAQLSNPGTGQILRAASAEDQNELNHLAARQKEEFRVCQQHVTRLQLPMELVDIEHIFGGERVVIYYLSEDRVDFRELVKCLAADFQTRIEMRQIGVRDEAKLLADYGDCGKPVCCNTHLTTMPPVSMKMAKLQKATLDPAKISGRCGRLKCCLRYEFDTYVDLQAELPRVGATILTRDGTARVLSQSILTSQVLVESNEGRRSLVHVTDIIRVETYSRGAGGGSSQSGAQEGQARTGGAAGKAKADQDEGNDGERDAAGPHEGRAPRGPDPRRRSAEPAGRSAQRPRPPAQDPPTGKSFERKPNNPTSQASPPTPAAEPPPRERPSTAQPPADLPGSQLPGAQLPGSQLPGPAAPQSAAPQFEAPSSELPPSSRPEHRAGNPEYRSGDVDERTALDGTDDG